MIENKQQYQITKEQVIRFERAIKETQAKPNNQLDPILQKAELDGMLSLLSDLQAELKEYESRS